MAEEDTPPHTKYMESFEGETVKESKLTKALSLALDVRKFEIDLYWKRATYFWAFTGAALAGYLTVLTSKDAANRPDALLLVSCLGLIFSVAWYFVNRASKFWQANWELHVDALEDKVMGPIYKTVLQDKSPFWKINASYPFSVTKINQLLSFFVIFVFLFLVLDTTVTYHTSTKNLSAFFMNCIGFTAIAILLLYLLGRTNKSARKTEIRLRSTEIVKYEIG